MPVQGHNASHYFYIHHANKPEWSKKLHDKNLNELLGFNPFNNSESNQLINSKKYFDHFNLRFGKQHFRLTTTYPGLLIGAGYSHHAIKEEGENSDYQLGFFFDHTLGIPVIPGSTVKGVLKNVFPQSGNLKEAKLQYVFDLIKDNKKNISKDNLAKYWKEIFFKNNNSFFHAFPIAIKKENVDNEKKLFAEDAITPHHPGDPDAIFKEPTPLKFIKVPAGVTFKFQFKINNYKNEDINISADTIKNVFKQILLDFGICAKRNVGYGHFTE